MQQTEQVAKAIQQALSGAGAKAAKSTWERDGRNWKYVMSVHGLLCAGTPVVHTKFILWADETRQTLRSDKLTYLYDLNCVYRTCGFSSPEAAAEQVQALLAKTSFGPRVRELSAVMVNGLARLNQELAKAGDLSAQVLEYAPAAAMSPCAETSFAFTLSVRPAYAGGVHVAYRPNSQDWYVRTALNDAQLDQVIGAASELPAAVAGMVTKLLQKD